MVRYGLEGIIFYVSCKVDWRMTIQLPHPTKIVPHVWTPHKPTTLIDTILLNTIQKGDGSRVTEHQLPNS